MSHSTGQILHDQSEPATDLISFYIIITGIVIAASFIGCWGYYRTILSQTETQKELSSETKQLNATILDAQEKLNTLKWIDKSKGKVQLPISDAINSLVESHTEQL